MRFPPFHLSVSLGIVPAQVLFRQLHYLDIMGEEFLSFLGDKSLTKGLLVL